MTYEVVQYDPKHFEALAFNKKLFAIQIGKPESDLAGCYVGKGPAFTGLIDGRPVCIAGVCILWPGCGEAWAILSEEGRMHGLFVHRQVMTRLPEIAREYKLIRIQAAAEKDNKVALSWLMALGFEYEGEMPFYISGKHFIRLARIFPGV